jgi:hypothetical protein
MTLGLDLGTSGFRALWRQDRRLAGRQIAACYLPLDDDARCRKLLQDAHIPFCAADDSLLVVGDEALELGPTLHLPVVPLLPDARLPEQDPVARQIAAALVESVLPSRDGGGRLCVAILPGDDLTPGATEAEFFTRLLRLMNYQPVVLAAQHALALAELGGEQLTGIGLTFGAGTIGVCLLHQGRLATAATIRAGGDWIDRQVAERLEAFTWDAAGNRYLDTAGVAEWKHAWTGSILQPNSDVEDVLSKRYHAALDQLLQEFRDGLHLLGKEALPQRPLPIVCHGGGAQVRDFDELLLRRWAHAGLPLAVRSVRIVRNDPWTIARGCLIHGEVEESSVRAA